MRLIDADALVRQLNDEWFDCWPIKGIRKTINEQPTIDPVKRGEWDMFELITSAYFGKQYYFLQEDGIVYSRQSCKYMTRDKAIQEFLDIIGE